MIDRCITIIHIHTSIRTVIDIHTNAHTNTHRCRCRMMAVITETQYSASNGMVMMHRCGK